MTEFSVIGKSIPRVDAQEKVTGAAKFSIDSKLPGMLHAKLLRSPYPHAKILGIDTSKAEKLSGVRAIITGKEQPDVHIGVMLLDQHPIARNVVRFIGEPVATVAADTVEIAEDALELIDVDYEELPAVFDVEESMGSDCPVVIHPDLPKYQRIVRRGITVQPDPDRPNVYHTWRIRQGNIEKGFQEAALIVENRYYAHRTHHCCLECHHADAWVDPHGVLTVQSPKQGTHLGKFDICRFFSMTPSQVRMLKPYVGGGFGGKIEATLDVIVAMLVLRTGRPVRLSLTREEVFTSTVVRAPLVVYIKDGVSRDGILVAREIKAILDSGAYSVDAALIVRNACFGAVGTYRIPNFKWDSYGVYTNNCPSGAFRGFGTPAILWAIEQQMNIIAEKLGIDPVELRKRNILREGDVNVQGQVTHSIGAEECLDRVVEWLEQDKPLELGAGHWKTGKGIALGNKYTMAGTTSCVHVKVHPDRVIEVQHGLVEMGQGLNTVLAQIAAEEFGISVDHVKVVWGDSAFMPYDLICVSSRSTWQAGLALQRACQDAKRQIFELSAPKLGVSAKDLETSQWQVYVNGLPSKAIQIGDLFSPLGFVPGVGEIVGKGEYTCPIAPEDIETGQSERAAAYYTHMAHGVEIAVDVETGGVKVLRIAGCFDMGQPINPKMCEQQIEGGIGMGIGRVLYEEVVMDRGKILNPNFADYRVPTTMEMPSIENVTPMIAAVPHKEGPFGAKGLGEAVLCTVAPALANAFYNATGVRVRDLPLTSERILKALRAMKSRSSSGGT